MAFFEKPLDVSKGEAAEGKDQERQSVDQSYVHDLRRRLSYVLLNDSSPESLAHGMVCI